MNDLVSIVVPLYNCEKYIYKCVMSLVRQDYVNIEIIIVNDGSTDNSINEVKKFNDNRIKLFTIKNRGVGNARNYGIKQSMGKYIAFVDADDYVSVDYISMMVERMNNGVDFVVGGYVYKTQDKEIKHTLKSYKGLVNKLPEKFFVNGYCHPVWGKLFKLEIIKQNNIAFKDISISEDSFFNLEYLKYVYQVEILSNTTYFYINYNIDSNLTSKSNIEYFDIYKQLFFEYKRFFMNKVDYSEKIIYPQLYNLMFKIIASSSIKKLQQINIKKLYNCYFIDVLCNSTIKYNKIEAIILYLVKRNHFIVLKVLVHIINSYWR